MLGINPEVCHLNEGHAAFAVLERARWFMEENHVPFAQALAATRPGNLFTTHTAVEAGFDRFQYDAMATLTDYCNHCLLYTSQWGYRMRFYWGKTGISGGRKKLQIIVTGFSRSLPNSPPPCWNANRSAPLSSTSSR